GSPAAKPIAPDVFSTAGGVLSPSSAPSQPDYQKILTEFYQQHNATKVGDVNKHLTKYQVSSLV
ncbi:MAG TPA: hypothetical protein V6D20_17510, partial [Candidatus Obscuribacterales bacterium]